MASKFDRGAFAKKMRELRRIKCVEEGYDVTQRDVAEAVGLEEVTISNYERAVSAPTYETAWRLADYFGVTLDELGCRKFQLASKE